MNAPFAFTLQRIREEALALAAEAGRPLGSEHLLLAFFTLPNPAATLLGRKGVGEDDLLDLLEGPLGQQTDPPRTVGYLWDRSQRMALADGSRTTGPLHLLGSLASLDTALAHRLLLAANVDMADLRQEVLRWIQLERQRQLPGGLSEQPLPVSRGSEAARRSAEVAPRSSAPAPGTARPERRVAGATGDPAAPAAPPRPPAAAGPSPTAAPASPASPADASAAPGPGERFRLDPQRFPTLSALGRNLTVMAAQGRIDPLVGREREVEEVIDILHKRRANNPCLIGEPGVGKTAIAEGLALKVASGAVPESMADCILVGLDVGSIVGGTQLRGSFNERMAALRAEVAAAEGSVVVFIDEIHTMLGAGASGENALDAAGELKQALARGEFPCIGATTTDEYRRYIEEDPALERRFQPVVVEEPSAEVALHILAGLAPRYGTHHRVQFSDEALESAVRLSARYISDRFLPDKAINLLDLAGARAHRQGLSAVGHAEVAEVVARATGIPLEKLLSTDGERLLRMEAELGRQIIGHEPVLRRICQTIRRNYAGFSSERPIGSFLFLGPTGVGKTETVKVLADFLFQSRDAMTRLDMSEYMEPHSVARMIGSPPGYVGHEEGGQLTEALRRRPYQIVLLDEIEKAHRDVLNVLLQVLDEGKLTDGRGRSVDFSNTVVVMTSNLGSQHYGETRRSIGFGAQAGGAGDEQDEMAQRVLQTAKRAFPPELWNRIEERLVFAPLESAQVADVARLLLSVSSRRLQAERGISFAADDSAVQYLIEHGGYDREMGARPMRQAIQRLVEGPIAEQILAGRARRGDRLRIHAVEQGRSLAIDRLDPEGAAPPNPAGSDGGAPPAAPGAAEA